MNEKLILLGVVSTVLLAYDCRSMGMPRIDAITRSQMYLIADAVTVGVGIVAAGDVVLVAQLDQAGARAVHELQGWRLRCHQTCCSRRMRALKLSQPPTLTH